MTGERISVYIPAAQAAELRRLSRDTERSVSWLVSVALRCAWPVLKRFVRPNESERRAA